MDINNLAEIWSTYDKSLSDSLRINTQLFKHIQLDKSRSEIGKPLQFEVFSVCVYLIVATFVCMQSVGLIGEPKFSVPGFATVGILVIYMILSVKKIISMAQIEPMSTPVVQLQKQISLTKVLILKLRKIEILLVLPFALTIIPIFFKAVHHIDVYKDWGWLVAEFSIVAVISFPVIYLFNKYWYDKKIHRAEEMLASIAAFEKN